MRDVTGVTPTHRSNMPEPQLSAESLVPDFELPDVRGGTVRLSDVLQRDRAVLVFYRGGWCPICNAQLGKLSAAHEEFRARGAEVLAISNEAVRQGEKVLQKIGPPYPLLLDERSEVIGQLGLTVSRRDPLGWALRKEGYAHPAVMIVGRDGALRWQYVGKTYRDRPKVSAILAALDARA